MADLTAHSAHPATSSTAVQVGASRMATRVALILMLALIAALMRSAPYLADGVILTPRENDDAVLLISAMAFAAGHAPYADFVFLHPPGSVLLLTPLTWTASNLGDAGALALGRWLMITLGALNTTLIAVLLRKYGWGAVCAGAPLYAVWPAVVTTEQTIMLEPIITLSLLAALLLARRRSAGASLLAGVILGLATTVKVWAVVDILILVIVIGATAGARPLRWFCTGAASSVFLVCAPFFIRSPASMWEMAVTTQLSRPSGEVGASERLSISSPLLNLVDAPTPILFAALAFLVVVTTIPLLRALGARQRPRLWSEQVWWGIIALAHIAILAASAVYFYHYATWAAAPISLVLGATVAHLRRGWSWALAAPAMTLAVAHIVALPASIIPSAYPQQNLADWATTRTCVFGWGSDLIAADAVSRNFKNGCPQEVDPGGVFLLMYSRGIAVENLSTESLVWLDHQWRVAQGADGIVITNWRADWLLTATHPPYADLYVEQWNDRGVSVWNRR